MSKYLLRIVSVAPVFCVIFCCTVSAGAIEIKTPSVKTIYYADTLVLHADFSDVQIPDGYSVLWTVDSDAVFIEPSMDGTQCYVTSAKSGIATVKISIVGETGEPMADENGNEICDTQEIRSKAGCFFRFIFLLRRIFLSPRLIPMTI